MVVASSHGRFFILSKAHIVLCLDHITCVQYNPELKQAVVWLTNGKMIEVIEPQDYNELVGEIADHSDYHLFKGVKKQ